MKLGGTLWVEMDLEGLKMRSRDEYDQNIFFIFMKLIKLLKQINKLIKMLKRHIPILCCLQETHIS